MRVSPSALVLIIAMALLASCNHRDRPEGDLPVPILAAAELDSFLAHAGHDTTYVVNFFATWCKPCVEEVPHMQRLATTHANWPVQVILVSLDNPRQYHNRLLPFVQKHNLSVRVFLIDDEKLDERLSLMLPQWEGIIPVTLIVRGSKRQLYQGALSYQQLVDAVEAI